MNANRVTILLVTILGLTTAQQLNTNSFPENFLFGVATASYQIEGAWNASGKSENIWDHLTHNYPELILDGSNGDIACDSYHRIDEDIALLRNLGVDFYRFSISWTRLLPNSYSNTISEDGLRYYNALIDSLIAANITPMVTMYHWDLPQELQLMGGWANPIMAEYFTDYAQVLFEQFGDRVKSWITFNEPSSICNAYGSTNQAPANVRQPGIGEYLCAHTLLRAHARAFRLYDEEYRGVQGGEMGITLAMVWFEPNSTSSEDLAASETAMQFGIGLYAHPIFTPEGDYPDIVKTRIAERSAMEGFPFSRLPEFTQEEIRYIRGTADFIGLNHYSTIMVASMEEIAIGEPSMANDMNVMMWPDPEWETAASDWLWVVPWGFRNLLVWMDREYSYPIYVTENGFSDLGEIEDDRRLNYFQTYLSALLDALEDGANVRVYTAWSLMDNFEWLEGYVNLFGIHYVNMSDPGRPRTIKKSGEYLKQVFATRRVIDSTSGGTIRVIPFSVPLLILFASAPVLVCIVQWCI